MGTVEPASRGLFRPESLEGGRRIALGSIQINTPPAHWAASGLAAAFVAALISYFCLCHYTRREQVSGMLVPAGGMVTLNAASAGDVWQVDVREGERVSAGQTLAEFDNPLASAALGSTLVYITSELETERKGLLEDVSAQRALAASQGKALRRSVESLKAQLEQIDSQLALQTEEATTLAAFLKRITPLSQEGMISVYDLQQQQAQTFKAALQVKALTRERLATEQQLSQAEQQLAQVPLTLETHEDATRNQLAQVEQDIAQNEARRAWVLRAPRSGTIASLLVKSGQAVIAGQPLLSVLPEHSALEAQLLVPSTAIGFIRAGQRVLLRYQAFPYQKFGLHSGVVDQISRNALSPLEIGALTGEQTNASLYRVLVRLDRQDVDAYGLRVGLRAGMALQADILLDRRRLLEWIFEPLYGFGKRLLAKPAILPRRSGTESSA